MALSIDDRGVRLACPGCGRVNRVPFERLGDPAACGQCGADLRPPAEPIQVDSDSRFLALISSSALPVLVDFWAAWCAPCKMVAPEVESVARSLAGKLIVAKVDTEKLPALAQRFGIGGIPALLLFSGGREAGRITGARPAAAIVQFVNSTVDTGSGRQTAP